MNTELRERLVLRVRGNQITSDGGVKVEVVNTVGFFPTPDVVARQVVKLLEHKSTSRVLEPSAGSGALLAALYDFECETGLAETHDKLGNAIEINSALAESIRRFPKLIAMNPPFDGAADIKHIQHAIEFLKPGGRLVAICANGPRQADKLRPISSSWEELPPGTFKDTAVRAVLLTYDSPPCEMHAKREPAITGGCQDISLREGKVFDAERLASSPLFERMLF